VEFNEQRGDMCSFRLIEDQTCCHVLDHLQRFHRTSRETSCHSLCFDIHVFSFFVMFSDSHHVFRFLSCFSPCHLVHSSHLFSVPQLHVITDHFPTVFSLQVHSHSWQNPHLPFMPPSRRVKSGFLPHSLVHGIYS